MVKNNLFEKVGNLPRLKDLSSQIFSLGTASHPSVPTGGLRVLQRSIPTRKCYTLSLVFFLIFCSSVPEVGIEPTRLAARDFKSLMYTNFITRAIFSIVGIVEGIGHN